MARDVLPIVGAAIGGYFGGSSGAQWGYAIGSLVGNAIDPLTYKGPSIGDGQVQTSRDGLPIPIIWGIVGGIAGNIIQMGPLVRSTVKSGSKKEGITESEKVTRTFAIGIGRGVDGPIAGIIRCWENNKLIYDGRTGSGFSAVDNTAFLSTTTIYLGGEDQTPDSELEAISGVGSTPAYRGLAYIVFNNKDVTNFAGAIPQYKFEVWQSGVGLEASRVLAWWEFEEASGENGTGVTLQDEVGVVTTRFLPSNAYTSVSGVDGQASRLNGSLGEHQVAQGPTYGVVPSLVLKDQVWSCAFWWQTPSSLTGQEGTYLLASWVDTATVAGNRKWRVIYNASHNGFIYSIGNGPLVSDKVEIDTGNISLTPLTWYHVVITHDPDADEMSLTVSERGGAVGARLTASVAGGAIVGGTTLQEISIGRDEPGSPSGFAEGRIDMLSFWDETAILSESDVALLFEYEMNYSDLS